ncbi:helix-turn-helix domain-containing protein [Streptomyces sp. NPDC058001]|uniref:helix-turn-helix domain-containing protein n=1 Tax=Streptomyces sp. NPDC058001 TaxID=3346300 RepID=UPI0036E9B17D
MTGIAKAQRFADRLDEFLYLVGQMAWRPDAGLHEVVDWLHRQLGAEIAVVVGRAGAVEESTTGFPQEILVPLQPMLARLAAGHVASAATEVGTAQVRLEAVGSELPRRVLLLVSPTSLTRQEAAMASHTGSVIAVLHRARAADRAFSGYQQKARQLRLALFMALMAGDPVLARRMTADAVPELLDSDRLRVHLLRCAQDDRDRIAQIYQDPSGYHGPGLMVRCPVYDEDLICLIAEDESNQGNAEAPDGLGQALRTLVAGNPRYTLGISSTQPLRATAEAYDQARHALAVARNTPGRVAGYQGQEPLERLLPREAATSWARSFLRPMHSMPQLTVDITRFAMDFHRSGVARLLGISRNTVTAHLRRAQAALGLDLRDVSSRATLTLALAVTSLHQDSEITDERQATPTLERVLDTHLAGAWAQAFLKPLRDPPRQHVLTTLRTWITANTDAQQAALRLSISRTTVAAHLRTAERLLNRDLLTAGSGVHDLVYAFHLSGEIPQLLTPAVS